MRWIRITSGTLGLLAALLPLSGCGEARSAPIRPNILMVVMDTARGDRVSLNGYDRPTTPRLDAFAADAVVYSDAWSPAGWTGPAHASLFTGLRPERHGYLRGNREYLAPQATTLAEILRDAGYRTGCLTNNPVLESGTGLLQGFDRLSDLYLEKGRDYPWAPETHRRALEWIDEARRAGQPFFVFVNDMEPHLPYQPAPAYEATFVPSAVPTAEREAARDMPLSAVFAHNFGATPIPPARLRILSDLYDAEIAGLDAAIGDLLDELRARGILDDTIVVITSDHGENLGDHGLTDHIFSLHRTVRHVPLLVRYPPRLCAGQRVADAVRLEDVAPTVLELACLPVPPDLDGVSLLHDLPGRIARASLGPPLTFIDRVGAEYRPGESLIRFRADLRAVYDGRYHFIWYSDGREELYDVEKDPAETRNLAPAAHGYAEILSRLRGLIP